MLFTIFTTVACVCLVQHIAMLRTESPAWAVHSGSEAASRVTSGPPAPCSVRYSGAPPEDAMRLTLVIYVIVCERKVDSRNVAVINAQHGPGGVEKSTNSLNT
jgi:hypothetical protein